jgi:hypothetical protein
MFCFLNFLKIGIFINNNYCLVVMSIDDVVNGESSDNFIDNSSNFGRGNSPSTLENWSLIGCSYAIPILPAVGSAVGYAASLVPASVSYALGAGSYFAAITGLGAIGGAVVSAMAGGYYGFKGLYEKTFQDKAELVEVKKYASRSSLITFASSFLGGVLGSLLAGPVGGYIGMFASTIFGAGASYAYSTKKISQTLDKAA